MRFILFILALFVFTGLFGQYKGPQFPINDEWFRNYGSKGLQIGDLMPDIPLGSMINNKSGKKRFSDFKGKLVILDFWDTSCSSCIAGFPKMEELQKEFGDQIQIFLVNVRENEANIRERTNNFKAFKMPDLPCIEADRPFISVDDERLYPHPLARLFPTQGVPHHAWIDPEGVIRMIGGPYNTYAGKIRDLLAGKTIEVLKNSSILPDIKADLNARYYQQLGYMKNTSFKFGSFITSYTNEVTGYIGTFGINRSFVDSTNGTQISYFINEELLNLYKRCFKNITQKSDSVELLFSPVQYPIIEFPKDIDTLNYTADSWFFQRQLTTEELVRSKYCYEQVIPFSLSASERSQMMLEDLNRYFRVHYGITGSKQTRVVPCYELIRITDRDKMGVTNSSLNFCKVVKEAGQSFLEFQGNISGIFPALLQIKGMQLGPGVLKDSMGRTLIVINGTGWPKGKRVHFKSALKGLHTLTDLRRLLQQFDLDLVEKRETLTFSVFTRVDENK